MMAIIQPNISLINQCGDLLVSNNYTIAFAESATCGRIVAEFAMATQSGDFLKGGIACYDASIKENLLKVNPALIEKFTPESIEVTKAITFGIKPHFDADILVGCTGLTTRGGSEHIEKPVGTMFFYALHKSKEILSERIVFEGTAIEIVVKSVNYITQILLNYLTTQHKVEDDADECLIPHQNKGKTSKGDSNEWSVSWP